MRIQFVTLLVFFSWVASQCLRAQENQIKFIISTDYGEIKGYLFNDTPKHRDNFVKLVEQGWYNGSIFHRVINNFMIQGGQGSNGQVDPGYTIPAEILPHYFHKKGALAAARMPDQINPQKASSGSQFYIVQGQIFDEPTLDQIEKQTGRKFSPEQRKIYTTVGGSPHLDGAYTVFGQVTEGFEVIDKIASVPTGPADKPLKDVKMTIRIIR